MAFKPIDTYYNGRKFRSRLEARWAVFFDELGVVYQYEPEGFDLAGTRYLPDFHLPRGLRLLGMEEPLANLWIEIKPNLQLSDHERKKLAAFVKQTGYYLLLIAGEPGPDAALRLLSYGDKYVATPVKFVEIIDGDLCLLEYERSDEVTRQLQHLSTSPSLHGAYHRALQERFEHQRKCRACGRSFTPYRDHYFLCPACFQARKDLGVSLSSTAPTPASLWQNPRLKKDTARQPGRAGRTFLYAIGSLVLLVLIACMLLFILASLG